MSRMMNGEIYDALKEAGAGAEKARAAARAVVMNESRFSKIEGDLNLLKWVTGANVGLTITILFAFFRKQFFQKDHVVHELLRGNFPEPGSMLRI